MLSPVGLTNVPGKKPISSGTAAAVRFCIRDRIPCCAGTFALETVEVPMIALRSGVWENGLRDWHCGEMVAAEGRSLW